MVDGAEAIQGFVSLPAHPRPTGAILLHNRTRKERIVREVVVPRLVEDAARVDVKRLEGTDAEVLPLVEEALRVGKRRVETGRVRIAVTTEAEEHLVRETLRGERAEVERIPIGRELASGEAAPVARHEPDGTYVLPVLEEVLVIERRLVLREELRLRLVRTEEPVEETVTLRRQVAEVERLPPEGAGEAQAPRQASALTLPDAGADLTTSSRRTDP